MTGEFYIKKDLFPGFGRPFVFNAEVLLKLVERFYNYVFNNNLLCFTGSKEDFINPFM